jgi:hypothetical protein
VPGRQGACLAAGEPGGRPRGDSGVQEVAYGTPGGACGKGDQGQEPPRVPDGLMQRRRSPQGPTPSSRLSATSRGTYVKQAPMPPSATRIGPERRRSATSGPWLERYGQARRNGAPPGVKQPSQPPSGDGSSRGCRRIVGWKRWGPMRRGQIAGPGGPRRSPGDLLRRGHSGWLSTRKQTASCRERPDRDLPIGWSNHPPVRPSGRLEAGRSRVSIGLTTQEEIGLYEYTEQLLQVGAFQSPAIG